MIAGADECMGGTLHVGLIEVSLGSLDAFGKISDVTFSKGYSSPSFELISAKPFEDIKNMRKY